MAVLSPAAMILYPLTVYFGLKAFSPQLTAGLIALFWTPVVATRIRRAKREASLPERACRSIVQSPPTGEGESAEPDEPVALRRESTNNDFERSSNRPRAALGHLELPRSTALLPVMIGGVLGASAMADSKELLLLLPVAINLSFLISFGITLGSDRPMVERFARFVDRNLTLQERKWCRLWTWLWTAFFVTNAAIALVLSQLGALAIWTAYNGAVSYVIIGTMFSLEYTLRKYRFGRLKDHFLDRQLARTFALVRKM